MALSQHSRGAVRKATTLISSKELKVARTQESEEFEERL